MSQNNFKNNFDQNNNYQYQQQQYPEQQQYYQGQQQYQGQSVEQQAYHNYQYPDQGYYQQNQVQGGYVQQDHSNFQLNNHGKNWKYFKHHQKKKEREEKQYIFQNELALLQEMGFTKKGKNMGLLQKYKGNIEQVVQALEEKNQRKLEKKESKQQNFQELESILQQTRILLIDCNNVLFANQKFHKKEQALNSHVKRAFKKYIKQLFLWAYCSQGYLKYVELLWDHFDFRLFEGCVKSMEKQQKKKGDKQFKNFIKQQKHLIMKQIYEQLKNAKLSEINKIIFKYDTFEEGPQVTLQSATPNYKIADDMICQKVYALNDKDKAQTTVVSSDIELRERLTQLGVSSFLGNGQWYSTVKTLKQQIKDTEIKNLFKIT